jgi:hypothetical protein
VDLVKLLLIEQHFHLSAVPDVDTDRVLSVSVVTIGHAYAVTPVFQLSWQIRSYEFSAAGHEDVLRVTTPRFVGRDVIVPPSASIACAKATGLYLLLKLNGICR